MPAQDTVVPVKTGQVLTFRVRPSEADLSIPLNMHLTASMAFYIIKRSGPRSPAPNLYSGVFNTECSAKLEDGIFVVQTTILTGVISGTFGIQSLAINGSSDDLTLNISVEQGAPAIADFRFSFSAPENQSGGSQSQPDQVKEVTLV